MSTNECVRGVTLPACLGFVLARALLLLLLLLLLHGSSGNLERDFDFKKTAIIDFVIPVASSRVIDWALCAQGRTATLTFVVVVLTLSG